MNPSQLFLERHEVLYDFWLGSLWKTVPEELMRQRPHARVNSIAWILWHLTRVEDAGLNRFVVDRPQVLDEGSWMQKMDLPWRHNGGEMDFAGVDDLSRRINLKALRGYSTAVRLRTREIVTHIDPLDLDAVLKPERVRTVLIDEGWAYAPTEELIQHYTSWTRGKCLMIFGLTHPYQHIGEIDVIASLLGVEF